LQLDPLILRAPAKADAGDRIRRTAIFIPTKGLSMASQKKITVIGGSGYAGSAIVREAAHRGHAVTAVSRSIPDSKVDGVEYVAADVLKAAAPIRSPDVVVAALSPRGDNAGTLAKAYARLTRQA
jgi:nucleoside-diphosphate-sugar epimerase